MKNLLFLGLSLVLFSCEPHPNYQQYSVPTAQPSVVVVKDNSGSEFLMNYMLYQSLMRQGGESTVHNYYSTHRTDPEFSQTQQQTYRQKYEEEVRTTKSSGFGSKPVETTSSEGFGKQEVKTNSSSGFGSNTQKTTPKVSTNPSKGFGNTQRQVTPTSTVKTNSSSGFGKRQ